MSIVEMDADNATQVAGSPGGVAYMIAAVSYIIIMTVLLAWPASIYLWHMVRSRPLELSQVVLISGCFSVAAILSVAIGILQMRSGVQALEELG